MYSTIQTLDDQLESFQTYARESACERICTDEHHGSNRRRIERFADTDRMTEHDVALKRFDLVTADDLVLEGTETGRYSIRYFTALEKHIDRRGRAINVRYGTFRGRS